MKKVVFIFFLLFVLQACNKPLKEYTLNDGMLLQLYSDSTFKQDIRLLERKYSVSGTWSGTITDGASFTTKRIEKGTKKEIVINYNIINNQAVPE